jgi:GNAT superfamily N-acetyltransferase
VTRVMTNTDTTMVRRAEHADIGRVATILTDAFLHGDLAGWLVPNLDQRQDVYPPYFRMLAEHAVRRGHVELIDDAAAALWYDLGPDLDQAPALDDYDQRLAAITGSALDRFQHLDHAMHTHHPRGTAHAYLAFLAVRPPRQGQGLGATLLRHRHTHLDQQRRPAYLEATGTRNRRLYQRHGYHPLGPYLITGPPAGARTPKTGVPRLYPMWRPPAP